MPKFGTDRIPDIDFIPRGCFYFHTYQHILYPSTLQKGWKNAQHTKMPKFGLSQIPQGKWLIPLGGGGKCLNLTVINTNWKVPGQHRTMPKFETIYQIPQWASDFKIPCCFFHTDQNKLLPLQKGSEIFSTSIMPKFLKNRIPQGNW